MRGRVPWADTAKGASIVLVVLWHVTAKHVLPMDLGAAQPVAEAWSRIGAQLLPLRMPLFFLVSGMFAVGAVARPWPVLLRTRILRFAALYAVWLTIQTVVMLPIDDFGTAHARSPLVFLAQLTISPTNLWFLFALAAYFLVARLTRRIPTAPLLLGAAVVSAIAGAKIVEPVLWVVGMPGAPGEDNLWQVFQNLFFFLAGLRLREAVAKGAARVTVPGALMLAGGYAAALVVSAVLDLRLVPGVAPAVSIVAVSFGVAASALAPRVAPRLAAGAQWLGRRTLPIYVLHMPLLAYADVLLRGPVAEAVRALSDSGGGVALAASWMAVGAWPLVLTGLLIAACLLLHAALCRLGAARLFAPIPDRSAVPDPGVRRRSPRGG